MADVTETPAALDETALRGWIGRQDQSDHVISAEFVTRFDATFDALAAPVAEGADAPHLLHFCLPQAIVATAELDRDGHPERGAFLPPVPLPRRMWAAGEVRFHDEVRVGERLRRLSRIADVKAKTGASGPLCFVTLEHRFSVGARHVFDDVQTIVYRENPTRGAPAPASPAAPPGAHRRAIAPTTPLLFRYSAVMFNAHRIHYDRDYATQVEGYPGLVVQGPLMATLLFRFAQELGGRRPDRFVYRGETPVFDTEPFWLNAAPLENGEMRLWTAREGGPIGMSARAIWNRPAA